MKRFFSLTLAALLLLSCAGCSQLHEPTDTPSADEPQLSARVLVEALYPQMAQRPNRLDYTDEETGEFDSDRFYEDYDVWLLEQASRRLEEGATDNLSAFLAQSIPAFLSGAETQNCVYSPLNVYLALGMLSELTDGNSRQQILDLLGSPDIEALRTQAGALWKSNYCSDGITTTVLASSLWLNEDVDFIPSTLDTLAQTYYASTYQGVMGSEAFNQMLQNWLNEQTGGLLKDQASQIQLSAETILALATTIHFRAKWQNEFMPEQTQQQTFHAPSGDLVCDFMHQSGIDAYCWGDHFSAVRLLFAGHEAMWFLLPDEGFTPEDLLSDPQVMDFLLRRDEWENSKYPIVNKSIPKFDVTSQLDLQDGLKTLGVTDVFDSAVSDFTPMSDDAAAIALSQVNHDARVTIDEEGCTAAAYTVMLLAGTAMPEEEVDFVLDRPFLFAITGNYDSFPLFVGVVNQPITE